MARGGCEKCLSVVFVVVRSVRCAPNPVAVQQFWNTTNSTNHDEHEVAYYEKSRHPGSANMHDDLLICICSAVNAAWETEVVQIVFAELSSHRLCGIRPVRTLYE